MVDTYIEECVNSRIEVTIITMNGFQFRGVIVHDFCDYIVVKSGGKKAMIYKHAISTIKPQ